MSAQVFLGDVCEVDPKGMKIAVAMSGGVDSSVTAMMLQERGFDVMGITAVLFKSGVVCGGRGEMSVPPHVADARRVAESVGIPLHVVDLCDEFKAAVIDDFVDTYLKGQTPLPCARCNRRIKFGALMDKAQSLGAQALATGHYVRKAEGPMGPELYAARSKARDQSYFLFGLSKEQLDFARFPLGGFASKDETRALARRYGLAVSDKPDSQDICFVPDGGYARFLAGQRPDGIRGGDIVDESGRVLGRHEGIIGFTVGQRRGINLSDRVGENNEPLFVLRLDPDGNRVVVGPRAALMTRSVVLMDVNWLGDAVPAGGLAVSVKLRSSQNPVAANFSFLDDGRGVVSLEDPVFGVSPGQAGVMYVGDRLVGGGWIAGG